MTSRIPRREFSLTRLAIALTVVALGAAGCESDESDDTLGSGATTGSGTGGTTSTSTSGAAGAAAEEYVVATNAVRAAVTEPAGYTGTWAALPNVAWSDTVAASAQAWADHLAADLNCDLEHEAQNTYGENLVGGSNLSPSDAVAQWASEKDLYAWSATYTMEDFNGGSGHYTQLVWRETTEIGCGSASCANAVVTSCRYLPPGNMLGSPVY